MFYAFKLLFSKAAYTFFSVYNHMKKLGGKQSHVGLTDRGVLLLQLGHDGGVVPLAGHEEPEHLLPVFGHDEL